MLNLSTVPNTTPNTSHPTEVSTYCQNFNRMKSAHKISEIQKAVDGCLYSIILGTETSWDDGVHSEEVFGSRFNVYRDDRDLTLSDKKSGGGVLVAISSNFDSELIPSRKFKEFEHVWVKTKIGRETHIFASVYFPPQYSSKGSFENFFDDVDRITSKFEPEYKIHLYGDFNQRSVDFIRDEDNECILIPIYGDNETLQFFFEKSAQFGFNQINHIKNVQNRYLDLLFTNSMEDFCVMNASNLLWKNEAFHTAIEYSIFIHEYINAPDELEFEYNFNFKNADFSSIKQRLQEINWSTLLGDSVDINLSVDKFYEIVYETMYECIPMKKRKRRNNSLPPWFNTKLTHLRNRKQKAHKLLLLDRSDHEKRQEYSVICHQLKEGIDVAYEEYNRKIESEIKTDPKRFFNYVKTKLNSNNFPSKMYLDEKVGASADKICNLFADFFDSVYTSYSESDRDRNYFTHMDDHSNDIFLQNLSENEILLALHKLDDSKSPGPDGIPPLFIKKLASVLVKPLYLLFNLSISSGSFPNAWKKSFLVPIFKSGKRSDVSNYRGIALISCIPKLFEAIINEKLFSQVKHFITDRQHGFFKGRSTATNLLHFVSYALCTMDNGNFVQAVYTDFSKAFDRVDIPMLLFKLMKIGFNTNLLNWLESYLTHRKQIVKFEGKFSRFINVTSGVPQGSHLGPLLFILYINDVCSILKRLEVLIYADDMKLYMAIENPDDMEVLQYEVNKFYIWCQKSLLNLNIKKCNSIIYSRKQRLPNVSITLGNELVEKCNKIRDLGVILDSKLSFVEHYNFIINKANSMLNFIKRFSYNFENPYTLKTLYVAYVRSILEYCSVVWSPFLVTVENRIESVQKQFILYALRKLGWTAFPLPPYESRLMLINLETLKKRREFTSLSFVSDIISYRIDSPYILQRLNFYAPSRMLRTRNLFSINSHRTNYATNEPLNRMMNTYNNHSDNIDITMSKNEMKKIFYSRPY